MGGGSSTTRYEEWDSNRQRLYRDTAPETKTRQGDSKKNQGPTAFAKHRDRFKGNIGTCLKGQVYNSAMIHGAETWALITQAKNKLAAAQTKTERSMLNITYRDRKTNIWVREKGNGHRRD